MLWPQEGCHAVNLLLLTDSLVSNEWPHSVFAAHCQSYCRCTCTLFLKGILFVYSFSLILTYLIM